MNQWIGVSCILDICHIADIDELLECVCYTRKEGREDE